MNNTSKALIKAGKLVEAGYNYITDNGVLIERVYTGRRGTLKWKRQDEDYKYRNLWDAYYQQQN